MCHDTQERQEQGGCIVEGVGEGTGQRHTKNAKKSESPGIKDRISCGRENEWRRWLTWAATSVMITTVGRTWTKCLWAKEKEWRIRNANMPSLVEASQYKGPIHGAHCEQVGWGHVAVPHQRPITYNREDIWFSFHETNGKIPSPALKTRSFH